MSGGRRPKPLHERFWPKVDRSGGPDSCWIWAGCRDGKGYGRLAGVSTGGTQRPSPLLAHRVSYEIHIGPIEDGLYLDHLCRNPPCVNPAHLEPVTPKMNMHRGMSPQARSLRTNRCRRGHELTPENTRVRGDGRRTCKECERLRRAKRV